ncbi:MAG: hypothetical protein AAFX06_16370, partial [Planctomycetota bacterium]
MRRVIVPALLAVALVASTSADAQAFGLFGKLCGGGCDTGCAEPACGCEVVMEPACGCEAPAPSCGCEVVAPSCGPKFGGGLLKKLFSKHNKCGCDMGCAVEPACGCEIAAPACGGCAAPAPTCGCEVAAPTCGCEVAAPACGCEVVDPCGCAPKKRHFGGLLKKLFSKKHSCCDSGCDM